MTREQIKTIRRTIRFYLIKYFLRSIAQLPTSKIPKLKKLLLKAFFLLGKKEVEKARRQIPEEFAANKERLIYNMMENSVMTILEILFYDKITKENPNYCKFKNWEIIENILKNGQVPCFLTAHFGNWEVLGYELVKAGIDLSVIARANNLNKMTEFINSFRNKHGMKVIMQNNILEATRLLKQKKPVAILADLNARKDGYQVDFFGHNASFYSAPVIISVRSKMPLVPIFAERQPDGTFIMEVQEPIQWEKGESMRDRVQKIAKIYEKEFTKRPDLWCWYHARYEHAEQGKIQ